MTGAAAVLCLAAALGCKRPVVGDPTTSGQAAAGPVITIAGATVQPNGHVRVDFAVTQAGTPLTLGAALALGPSFTLAELTTHPVDGLAAWKSPLLTGSEVALSLPPSGPGTPPSAVISGARQPGAESSGTFGGTDGALTYEFAAALPGWFSPTDTLRVGVYLSKVAAGTATTTATHDFRPAGGAAAPRDTVLVENCNRCHGMLAMHGGKRVGVKICLTCHTWQNSDPDTVDPAAQDGATASTDPNPLELGRLVHRIHRGKNLPTLYQAAAGGSAVPAPTLPSATALPLPFLAGRNTPIAGRKYSIVGYQSRELVFGRVASRTDNGVPARAVPEGVAYPRDLRECGACHGGAPQEYEILYAAARRTCQGCHPEVWFGSTPITDAVHFAHPGGPQADDTQCRACHVVSTPPQKLYAPIAEIHVVPRASVRANTPIATIRRVVDFVPGGVPDGAGGVKGPTVVFTLSDRVGDLLQPNAPSPANDTTAGTPSPVPRAFASLAIRVAGPAAPDYAGAPVLNSGDPGNPSPLTLVADATTHELAYTFATPLPAGATGTFAVGLEGRRRATPAQYSTATDTFNWPYTGEQVTESFDNPVVHVDTAAGGWTPASPAASPRRTVVAQQKCLRCHGRFELHGGQRHDVALCVMCHTPDRTDWGSVLGATTTTGRPKAAVTGSVNLAGTFDDVEERSIHFKVLVHRIHTGGRVGAAALDLVQPLVVYGFGGSPNFFDDVIFPNDLRDCTLCHEGRSYAVDALPPGAAPTLANENPTLFHLPTLDAGGNVVAVATATHAKNEPTVLPIQAACMGCHATGAAKVHTAGHTVNGVEQCASCHLRGSTSVDVVHGLAVQGSTSVAASFSSISASILVPRCASGACHGGTPPANFPSLDAGTSWSAIVQVPSQQASGLNLVEPFAPEKSYLLLKLRGDAGSVGGVATVMPLSDAALDPSDIAAVEAWIANGAPND